MRPWKKRAWILAGGLTAVIAATVLITISLKSNIALYVTPSDVVAGKAPKNKMFRIGGMVLDKSIQRDGTRVDFVITDTQHNVPVSYTGILPDLFKEGKGAVVQGKLLEGRFIASEVLAKHDENYMPEEALYAIEQAKKSQKTNQGL